MLPIMLLIRGRELALARVDDVEGSGLDRGEGTGVARGEGRAP